MPSQKPTWVAGVLRSVKLPDVELQEANRQRIEMFNTNDSLQKADK